MPVVARLILFFVAAGLSPGLVARAAAPEATMNKVSPDGVGEAIGTVSVARSGDGAVFSVNLKGLPPGTHGLHLHENGDCGPGTANGQAVAAGAAGGHWDPDHTSKHEGPSGQGHMGDLPALLVEPDGTAIKSLIAPRLKTLDDLRGHALMIHAGGDTFSDQPAPLGGGGARIACGVLK